MALGGSGEHGRLTTVLNTAKGGVVAVERQCGGGFTGELAAAMLRRGREIREGSGGCGESLRCLGTLSEKAGRSGVAWFASSARRSWR